MTPITLADRLESLIELAVEKYLDGINLEQEKIFRRVSGLLDQLTLTTDGLIKPTAANLKIIRKLDSEIKEIINASAFDRKIDSFISQFGDIGALNEEYFSGIAEAFVPNEKLFEKILKNASEITRESLVGAGIENELIGPLENILNINITSGASYFDLREQVRQFIIGGDGKLGRLERYSGQITRDALNQFSSTYHEMISAGLGLEWYLYAGGTVKDTRPFCAARAGKYYHRTEIEKWPSLQWAGKIPGTTASTIYVYRGGWACLHFIVAVHTSVVPAVDRARVAA